jgi:sulfur-oxidizing protein SoxZ
MARTLINMPKRARRGEIVEIKTLIAHVMETGYRRTETGAAIPRDILRQFVCTCDGEEVFRADIHPAIAANPYFAFTALATTSGTFLFEWTGDNGFAATESICLEVE